jgi:hypothetical protein
MTLHGMIVCPQLEWFHRLTLTQDQATERSKMLCPHTQSKTFMEDQSNYKIIRGIRVR